MVLPPTPTGAAMCSPWGLWCPSGLGMVAEASSSPGCLTAPARGWQGTGVPVLPRSPPWPMATTVDRTLGRAPTKEQGVWGGAGPCWACLPRHPCGGSGSRLVHTLHLQGHPQGNREPRAMWRCRSLRGTPFSLPSPHPTPGVTTRRGHEAMLLPSTRWLGELNDPRREMDGRAARLPPPVITENHFPLRNGPAHSPVTGSEDVNRGLTGTAGGGSSQCR